MLESRGQLTWGWEGGTEWGHLLLVEGVLAEKTVVCLSNHCGRQMFGRYNCQSILGPTSNRRGGGTERSQLSSPRTTSPSGPTSTPCTDLPLSRSQLSANHAPVERRTLGTEARMVPRWTGCQGSKPISSTACLSKDSVQEHHHLLLPHQKQPVPSSTQSMLFRIIPSSSSKTNLKQNHHH